MDSDRTAYEERKYCEDCRFFQSAGEMGPRYAKCLVPRGVIAAVQYVTRDATNPRFCENTRGRDDECGPEGKWFEPKPAVQEAAE